MSSGLVLAIVLQVIGAAIIIAEIIIPSGGILSILAVSIIGYSLWSVFTGISATAGVVFAVADAIFLPVVIVIGIKLLARSPATLRAELARKDGVTSQSPDLEQLAGASGTAATDLHPSGMARIDGRRVDVVTNGEYIEKGASVVVVSVTGNRVVVSEADSGSETERD